MPTHKLPKVQPKKKVILNAVDEALAKSKPLNTATCKKCGSTIFSQYRHDFQTCNCGAISIDGGQDYTRYIGNPADFVKYPLPLPKPDTVSYASTWTVGNTLNCTKCGKATDYLLAQKLGDRFENGTHVWSKIDKENEAKFARCVSCLPSPKWTVSKWVEVVKEVATDVSLTMFLGWLLLMSLAAVFTLIYAAVTAV